MTTHGTRSASVAQQLLDAQVAYHLDRLSGEQLASTVSALADDVLAAAGRQQIEDLVDRAAIKAIVVRALGTVPASDALGGIVQMATAIAYDGPAEPYPLGEVIDREQVEALLDALLALSPALEQASGRLNEAPLVGTVASRFMGRIVGEMMQANQAAANKVPGLGSLTRFGSGAASKAMGAADKQFAGVAGSAFAVNTMNRILVETLRDPVTREAALQVWDLMAAELVEGLSPYATRDEIDAVVDAVHALAKSALATEQAANLGEVIVDGFFDQFGGYTPTALLDEFDLDRGDLIADLVRIAPKAIAALRETGDLERILRTQLEPFYTSPEVAALLG